MKNHPALSVDNATAASNAARAPISRLRYAWFFPVWPLAWTALLLVSAGLVWKVSFWFRLYDTCSSPATGSGIHAVPAAPESSARSVMFIENVNLKTAQFRQERHKEFHTTDTMPLLTELG